MTQGSFAPTPHCVRRGRVCMGNLGLRFARRGHRLRLGETLPPHWRPPHQMKCRCVAFVARPQLWSLQRQIEELCNRGNEHIEMSTRRIHCPAAVEGTAAMQRQVGELAKPRKRKLGGSFCEWRFGARSAAGGMTALSPGRNVREHRFQMHHYRGCAGDPLMSWRGGPLSLLIFLCGGKESKCRPAQGQR
jgi:hypothetical protein